MHGLRTPMDAVGAALEKLWADEGNKNFNNVKEKVKLAEVVTVARDHDDLPRQVEAERKWMDSMILSMYQIAVEHKTDIFSYLFDANPVMEDLLQPTPDEEVPYERPKHLYANQTPIVFGLMLLVESTKSFMFPVDAPPQTANCRLKALGLARDMMASVKAVNETRPINPGSGDNYPICTDDKIVIGLQFLQDDLAGFLGSARWDFYYQAPWVAGSQMLWMLSQANDYGMMLCNRRRYLGAVLHLYNCLKQLDQIEAEPVLLERLCEVLGPQVFGSDSRPRTDFFKVWARYVGGELEYDPLLHHATPFYHSYNPQEDQLKFWPRDRLWRVATHKIENDKRISLSKISYFYALESIKYEVDTVEGTTALARMLDIKNKGGDATDEETEKIRDILAYQFLALSFEDMQPSIVSELEGEFPIARINWFAVYITCTGILEAIGKHLQANTSDPEQKRRTGYDYHITGVRFIEMFLADADQGTRHKRARRAWEKKEQARIKVPVTIIQNELREKKTADFVWKI